MAEPARERRSVVRALSLLLLGAAGLWRFLTPRARRARVRTGVPAADVPGDGALVLPEERCALVRGAHGILALDLTCPHLGCVVTATPAGFACPCHGSRFRPDGSVVQGPADRGLAPLAVEEHDGVVWVSREREG